jgi:acetyl-CoA carboxylase biotin carboxyl carrier protein
MAESWLDDVAELMKVIEERGDVDFLELTKGDLHIRLSRYGAEPAAALAPVAAAPAAALAAAPAAAAAVEAKPADAPVTVQVANAAPAANADIAERTGTQLVRAPMVGAFYRSPAPGSPPFVEVGSAISTDTTVALVEAMKVFVSVQAGAQGVVEEVYVGNGQFVEYDQPLMRIALQ